MSLRGGTVEGQDPWPRRRAASAPVLCALAAASLGCVGPTTGEGESDPARVGSVDELRGLIQAGAVAPVVAGVSEAETPAPDPLTGGTETLPGLGIPGGGSEAELTVGPPEDFGSLDDAGLAAEIDALAALIESDIEASQDNPERPGAALGDSLPQPGLASQGGGGASAKREPNPYLEFGERIVVHSDGRITKPFQVAPGKGKALLQMMGLSQVFPFEWKILESNGVPPDPREQALPLDVADIILLENWDFELYQNFTTNIQQPPAKPARIDLADWLVVTSGRETLRQVSDFIELFAGSVPQIEITASIVEVTFTDELDYGINGPDNSVLFDFPDGTFVDSLSYSMPNAEEGVEAILSIGAIQDGVAVSALLEAVQNWENVDIRTNPRIAVREGGVAEIINTQQIPSFNFTGINSQTQNFTAAVKFEEVGVKLYVAPRVMGADTIALNLFIEASQQIGTSVAFQTDDGDEFRSPLIAKRQARTVVYLEPGQAIAIGGLVSEREQESESKVPILGDIPFLGFLFKSTRIFKERTEVLFLIQPRLLEGPDFNQPVWDGSSEIPLRG